MSLIELEKQKVEITKSLESIEKEISDTKSSTIISCASCGNQEKIKDITLISEEGYVEPYSCSGGDYWTHNEYQYHCSKCKIKNRFLFNSYYKLEYTKREFCNMEHLFFMKNARLFNNIKIDRDNNKSYLYKRENFVNNYEIERIFKSLVDKETYLKFLKGLEKKYLSDYVDIPEELKELI